MTDSPSSIVIPGDRGASRSSSAPNSQSALGGSPPVYTPASVLHSIHIESSVSSSRAAHSQNVSRES
jgi:hypothetical protein